RRISADGIITTITSNSDSCYCFANDESPAAKAAITAQNLAVDSAGNLYASQGGPPWQLTQSVYILRPTGRSILISAVVDAASQRPDAISPGKIVVIYGAGLGPSQLVQNRPVNGVFSTQPGGTTVSFNGIAAPVLYSSATQVAAIVPYAT